MSEGMAGEPPVSKYWRVRCATCGVEDGSVNHGDSGLMAMVQEAEAISAFVECADRICVAAGGFWMEPIWDTTTEWPHMRFFLTHRGHDLRVLSEYGDLAGGALPAQSQRAVVLSPSEVALLRAHLDALESESWPEIKRNPLPERLVKLLR